RSPSWRFAAFAVRNAPKAFSASSSVSNTPISCQANPTTSLLTFTFRRPYTTRYRRMTRLRVEGVNEGNSLFARFSVLSVLFTSLGTLILLVGAHQIEQVDEAGGEENQKDRVVGCQKLVESFAHVIFEEHRLTPRLNSGEFVFDSF